MFPDVGSILEPGRYTSDTPGVTVTLTLGEGQTAPWTLAADQDAGIQLLSNESEREFIAIGRIGSWFDADEARDENTTGLGSIAADDIVFDATGLVPGQAALLFAGPNLISPGLLFGDGLRCAGGARQAHQIAEYRGFEGCRAAAVVSGGGKGCSWGCFGLADCKVACTFDAIVMNANGLPAVDVDKCTACGDCVDICPRDLFSLQPESRRLWVA